MRELRWSADKTKAPARCDFGRGLSFRLKPHDTNSGPPIAYVGRFVLVEVPDVQLFPERRLRRLSFAMPPLGRHIIAAGHLDETLRTGRFVEGSLRA
jgi:hypothetical protein